METEGSRLGRWGQGRQEKAGIQRADKARTGGTRKRVRRAGEARKAGRAK